MLRPRPACPSALRGAIPSCPMRRPRVAIWVPFAPIESEPHGLGRAPVRPTRVTAGPALPRAGIQQNWGSRSGCAFRPGRPDQSERFEETARPASPWPLQSALRLPPRRRPRRASAVRSQQGPAQNANYAWLQHFLHHCAPTGTVGTVLANGSLSSQQSGEGEIRRSR